MKNVIRASLVLCCLVLCSSRAQNGGLNLAGPQGPRLGGALSKVFGENKHFKSELTMIAESADKTEMSGTLHFSDGKSRFEMDIAKVKSAQINPAALAQMKEMGMANMIMITRPDKQSSYLVYPGMEAYVELALQEASSKEENYKIQSEELGKEVLEGHPCTRNKVTITGPDGKQQVSTVWNASDLKNFPIQILHDDAGQKSTMKFSKIQFEKPSAESFEAPQKFGKFQDFPSMIQGALMKRLGGGAPGKAR